MLLHAPQRLSQLKSFASFWEEQFGKNDAFGPEALDEGAFVCSQLES